MDYLCKDMRDLFVMSKSDNKLYFLTLKILKKMRQLILLISILLSNYLFSQIDQEANIFLDATPLWAHVAFDSTL
ncbi:MAG: hypothetical protein IPH96_13440 [Saprospiraceae bacterium]|nr:hypothetical protein [Saprospiraceae bacterium]